MHVWNLKHKRGTSSNELLHFLQSSYSEISYEVTISHRRSSIIATYVPEQSEKR